MAETFEQHASSKVGMARAVLECWALLWVLWVLLITPISPPDVLAGGVSAAIGATAFGLMRWRGSTVYQFPFSGVFLVLRRVPINIGRDAGLLLVALIEALRGREVRGHMVSLPFDAGEDDNSVEGARRALVVTGVSAAPNSCAIFVDRGRQKLLVHQLVPAGDPPGDRRWPL